MFWLAVKIQSAKRVRLSFLVSAFILTFFLSHNPTYSQASPNFELVTTLGYGQIQSLDWHDDSLDILTSGGVWRYDTSNLEDDSPTLTPYQTTYSGRVLAASFGTDVERIITEPESGRVSVETLANGERSVVDFQAHSDDISAIATDAEHNLMAVSRAVYAHHPSHIGDVFDIRVWDFVKGEELFLLQGHTDRINRLRFSPDGTLLASTSFDGTVRLWDMSTGEQVLEVEGTRPIGFSDDGQFLMYFAFLRGTFDAYDLTTTTTTEIADFQTWVWMLTVTPDYVAVGDTDGNIYLYDENFESLRSWNAHGTQFVTAIEFDDDQTRLATATDTELKIWDVATGSLLVEISQNFTDNIWDAVWIDDNTLATTVGVREVRLWDVNNSSPRCAHYTAHQARDLGMMQNNVIWIATGEEIVQVEGCDISSMRTVIETGSYTMQFNDTATQLAFWGRRGRNQVDLYDIETREEMFNLETPDNSIDAIDFDPSGALLASGNGYVSPFGFNFGDYQPDYSIRLWDTETGEQVDALLNTVPVYSLDFSPDGTRLASGHYNGLIRIWDVEAQRPVTYFGTTSPVWHVRYSNRYPIIVSGHQNGEVNVWNANTLEHIQTLRQHYSLITAIEFSPSEQYLAVSSYDGTTSIWTLSDE